MSFMFSCFSFVWNFEELCNFCFLGWFLGFFSILCYYYNYILFCIEVYIFVFFLIDFKLFRV